MSFSLLAQAINRCERFYIFTHRDPDGDAIGSAGALLELLRLLGKPAWFVLEKPLDPAYSLLVDFSRVAVIHSAEGCCSLLPGMDLDPQIPTLVIGVDYHDPLRLAELKELMRPGAPLAVSKTLSRVIIDHHKPTFVDPEVSCMVIDPTVSSCGALIYQLFKELNIEIPLQAARCLYWAVVSDTAKFSIQSTSSNDLEIAADCLKKGVEVSSLHLQLEERFEMSQVQRALKAMLTARSNFKSLFWIVELTFDPVQKAGSGALRWVHSVMPSMKEPVVWLVMLEESPGQWRFSARSKKDLRLGEFFSSYGGGGHGAAAGAIITSDPASVVTKLTAHVENILVGLPVLN